MSIHNEPIQTYARIKPLFLGEDKVFFKKNVCTVISKNQDEFGFDGVFDESSTNEDVYNQSTKKIIQHAFQGFNSCVLAYGQTASGKTYTMKGTESNPGIIPLCLRDIFNKLRDESITGQVIISYIEIYNEDVIDLLSQRENSIVQPREDQKRNLVLTGLQEFIVSHMSQAMQLLQIFLTILFSHKGQQKRKFASNNLNINSSRSHAIFRISLRTVDDDLNETNSQINLVDLAGSEGIDRTKAQKISKIQGENINKSILALTKVIKTMSERDQQWINFRDSKLTRILQKSLCQNSKSTVICMINPTITNYQQCSNTLKFGQMAAKIRIQARQNMIRTQQMKKKQQQSYTSMQFLPSEKMQLQEARLKLQNYQQQISRLRKINKQLEHSNYIKQQSITIFEKHCQELNQENQHLKKIDEDNRKGWWREKQMLDNRVAYFQQEIQRLEKFNAELKEDKRLLEKNERGLAQTLQYYQNQCRNLNAEIVTIKAKIDEQNSKTMKMSVMSNIKSQKMTMKKTKPNPFQLPPYKESGDRLSPSKLSWIVQLKIQVIDLGRQVNQFTKANVEIAEQNEELRRKIDEYQEKISKERNSGKINPQALEYNEIKKLNNKIKALKLDLKRSQERERKNRQILKKESNRNLIQMQEFQEWYNKKYVNNYFADKEVQANFGSERLSNEFRSSMNNQLNSQSQKGLILNKNTLLIKSQNPEENLVKQSDNEECLLSQEIKACHDQKRDTNVDGVDFQTRNIIRPSEFQSFLLDGLGPNNPSPYNSGNSKNFLTFDENSRSKINVKIDKKQKCQIPSSKQFKIEQAKFGSSLTPSNNMIPEQEKDVQI